MSEAPNHRRSVDRAASWTLIVGVALGLRVAAAAVVTWLVGRKGTLCVFADTDIYWSLAGSIVAGEPYQVSQWGVPHHALRTPGYPLFLAACRVLFGPSLLAVRLVQAGLGVGWGSGWSPSWRPRSMPEARRERVGPIPMVAAGLAAVEPYVVGMSALVLSEALVPPADAGRALVPGEALAEWGMSRGRVGRPCVGHRVAAWRWGGRSWPGRPGLLFPPIVLGGVGPRGWVGGGGSRRSAGR